MEYGVDSAGGSGEPRRGRSIRGSRARPVGPPIQAGHAADGAGRPVRLGAEVLAFLGAHAPGERDARVLPRQTVSAGATAPGPFSRQVAPYRADQRKPPPARPVWARMGHSR